MAQQDSTPGASEGATGAVVTPEAARGLFNGGGHVEKARPNGEENTEAFMRPQVRVAPETASPEPVRRYYTRIAPHEEPLHLDEYMAAALLKRFGAKAEMRWPGIITAEFRPRNPPLENFKDMRDDPFVLKLGWGGVRGENYPDAVDEHVLPDEERRNHCTTTLVAELLDLTPTEAFLVGPVLREVREGDKQGKQPSNLLHLSNLLMTPLSRGETYQKRLEIVIWALEQVMAKQQRFLDAAEQLQPNDTWHISWKRETVEVHVINYAESRDMERLEDVITAICRKRGAKMIVIRSFEGDVRIICDPEKQLPMTNVALAVRASECHKRSRPLPPLDQLRRRGTIPEVPEWHFSDAGNLLNGGRNPTTLIQLNELKTVIGHALDEIWMKTNGFTA